MFEPRILGFLCKWCAGAGADLAGTSRRPYPPNLIPIQVFCSSRVDPEHILWAFRHGADGILIGGCHPGDCHYQDGNYKTRKRILLLKEVLKELGVEEERLHLEWISASEGQKFVQVIKEFTERLRSLGPFAPRV